LARLFTALLSARDAVSIDGPRPSLHFAFILTGVVCSRPWLWERPEEEFYQHLVSSVGVGYNGRGMRLFTITAVCPEDQYAAQKATLKQIVDTFVVPPPLF